jgi:hypothetical protein
MSRWTTQSNHIWRVQLPENLAVGAQVAKVTTRDIHGNHYTETLAFEVVKRQLDQETEAVFQSDFFDMVP